MVVTIILIVDVVVVVVVVSFLLSFLLSILLLPPSLLYKLPVEFSIPFPSHSTCFSFSLYVPLASNLVSVLA